MTNETTEAAPAAPADVWTQPTRYISVPVGDNGRGHFVEVPQLEWLGAVAATSPGAANVALDAIVDYMSGEAKSAANKKDVVKLNDPDKEREAINAVVSQIAAGTYDAGDISGRDDFNRALLAASKDTLRNALAARGEGNPSEARISAAFKANYPAVMRRFGADVAAKGYEPAKKNVTKTDTGTTAKPSLGGLEI